VRDGCGSPEAVLLPNRTKDTTNRRYDKPTKARRIIVDDILKELKEEIKDALESERLVTARLVDSVLRVSQIAGTATPEMCRMFDQWLSLIGDQVLREVKGKSETEKGECDVPALARTIGVSETTLFSLLVFLHRSGRIRVRAVRFSEDGGENSEACRCLTQRDKQGDDGIK
jgi:predicted transcriptional regulator